MNLLLICELQLPRRQKFPSEVLEHSRCGQRAANAGQRPPGHPLSPGSPQPSCSSVTSQALLTPQPGLMPCKHFGHGEFSFGKTCLCHNQNISREDVSSGKVLGGRIVTTNPFKSLLCLSRSQNHFAEIFIAFNFFQVCDDILACLGVGRVRSLWNRMHKNLIFYLNFWSISGFKCVAQEKEMAEAGNQ